MKGIFVALIASLLFASGEAVQQKFRGNNNPPPAMKPPQPQSHERHAPSSAHSASPPEWSHDQPSSHFDSFDWSSSNGSHRPMRNAQIEFSHDHHPSPSSSSSSSSSVVSEPHFDSHQ